MSEGAKLRPEGRVPERLSAADSALPGVGWTVRRPQP
jgi:hypothetical protein